MSPEDNTAHMVRSLSSSRCMQVTVVMEAIDAEDFGEVVSKPLVSMPYGAPGKIFVAFQKPEGACSLAKFANTLRFYVKAVWPILQSFQVNSD